MASSVKIKWTDPDDISTNEPVPATWAGTVVVRKEGSPPLHRWDGTLIVDSTTKDEYSSTALEDNTVESNKTYYYGIFPYDTHGYYRYTKVMKLETTGTPSPVPAQYQAIIDAINGDGFFWKDFQQFTNTTYNEDNYYPGTAQYQARYPLKNASYLIPDTYEFTNKTDFDTHYSALYIIGCDIADINITSDGNNTYSFSVTFTPVGVFAAANQTYSHLGYYTQNDTKIVSVSNYWNTYTYSQSNKTLTEIFNYIWKNMRNVNIYVDGVLWSSN